MKRLLFGLATSLALGSVATAQDSPSARLRAPVPAASLGQPIEPVVARGQLDAIPKAMPKGSVAEPKKEAPAPMPMPMPAPAGPVPGPSIPGVTPGPVISGPVIVDPPGTTYPVIPGSPVIPGGPGIPGIAGPLDGCPTGECPVTPMRKWYTDAEGLVWWVRSFKTPVLAAVAPATAPNAVSLGALGAGGAQAIYGGDPIDANPRFGMRVTLGRWLSPCWAIEANAFYTSPQTDTFAATASQFSNQILSRPFFSANRLVETSELIGLPGRLDGTIGIETWSQLYGGELNLRRRIWDTPTSRLHVLGGYRFVRLEERVTIEESVTVLDGPNVPRALVGVEGFVTDQFRTKNQFHGGQLGLIYDRNFGRWTLNLTTKVAVGVTQQNSYISGSSAYSTGATTNLPGGLLALNSNIGSNRRDVFSVVPEIGINIGYDLTDRIRIHAGYSLLYWSSVARPGKQMDRTLDENSIPEFTTLRAAAGVAQAPPTTQVRPTTRIESEGFWAQGVNFGLLFKW